MCGGLFFVFRCFKHTESMVVLKSLLFSVPPPTPTNTERERDFEVSVERERERVNIRARSIYAFWSGGEIGL